MFKFVLIIELLVTVAMIGTILLQRSEGGALGMGGGGGGLMSNRGVGNALSRATAILAALFFVCSITLAILAARNTDQGLDYDSVDVDPITNIDTPAPTTPALPDEAGDAPSEDAAPMSPASENEAAPEEQDSEEENRPQIPE